MFRLIESLFSFFANLVTIISGGDALKKLVERFKASRSPLPAALAVLLLALVLIGALHLFQADDVAVTQVVLSDQSLRMSTGDRGTLTATVLYSDNSTDHSVLWISSNGSVASISETGQITALSAGTTVITAQAAKNNTIESAECVVTVGSPPSGYTISVSPDSDPGYYYIRVHPFDNNITHIQIYARSPSGVMFDPSLDINDRYNFYSETGTWTIYASLENEYGSYQAQRPEDFVSIEVTETSSSLSPYLF